MLVSGRVEHDCETKVASVGSFVKLLRMKILWMSGSMRISSNYHIFALGNIHPKMIGEDKTSQGFLGIPSIHQTFLVPKMEVLNLIRLFWGWVFPYLSRIHTAYIGFYTSILGT